MTDLGYWQTYAQQMAKQGKPVPMMPGDLMRLIEHATSLQRRVAYLETENRRLERLVSNGGDR
jgi:hypothetical protein